MPRSAYPKYKARPDIPQVLAPLLHLLCKRRVSFNRFTLILAGTSRPRNINYSLESSEYCEETSDVRGGVKMLYSSSMVNNQSRTLKSQCRRQSFSLLGTIVSLKGQRSKCNPTLGPKVSGCKYLIIIYLLHTCALITTT